MLRQTPRVDRLVVGLGNPGREYARSRHNAGFLIVDALARRHKLRFEHRWARSAVAAGPAADQRIALAKPQTYMNSSGDAVRALLRKLDLEPAALLIVADDIDLPLGRIRLRERGSSGGHRGVQSIIERLGTSELARVKVGVGRPDPREAAGYVLDEFAPSEAEVFDEVVSRAVEAIERVLADGLAAAMNEFNR